MYQASKNGLETIGLDIFTMRFLENSLTWTQDKPLETGKYLMTAWSYRLNNWIEPHRYTLYKDEMLHKREIRSTILLVDENAKE
jgi:hypothetical protein